DLTTTPRLRSRPFDRVITVVGLCLEWIEGAIRSVAPARVLIDGHVACASSTQWIEVQDSGQVRFVVGSALDECGKWPVPVWHENVRAQDGPIPHWHFDIALDLHSTVLR